MDEIKVTIETPDLTIEDTMIPVDYTAGRIVAEIIEVLNLPRATPGGQSLIYSLLHVNHNLPLPDDRTLPDCGVQNGDTIRLTSSNPAASDASEIEIVLSVLDLNRKELVRLQRDARVDELLRQITQDYGLPSRDKLDGPIWYRLVSKSLGRFLNNGETLRQAGVMPLDTLALDHEEIAGCFPETAKVLLPSGETAPIGQLKSMDVILAYDMRLGAYLPCEVEGIYQQTYSERIIINDLLVTTPDQHLCMADRTWRLASDIAPGDALLRFPFGETTVTEVRREQAISQMFSLTLSEQLCMVVEGFVVRDLFGKQALLPRLIDVFLSYSAADKDEARAIFQILERHGRTAFLAEKSIMAGEFWEDRIKEALKNCRHFWMLVTPNSLQSQWVTTEWATAWALDKRIVPILFRCRPEDLPRRLQSYQCVDFHQVEEVAASMRSR